MPDPTFDISVLLLAFGNPGQTRLVQLPYACKHLSEHDLLEQVFHYGQNDFQPQQCPSVSSGDVVMLPYGHDDRTVPWRCEFVGWRQLTMEELLEYYELPQEKRQFHRFKEPLPATPIQKPNH